ncbi:MAG: bifunctional phosphopantothenoylcysteine decarboxylase/phosphopantothenate--cysteine ligase CoaBC [Gemmatimonadales bacterium]
MWQGRRVVLGVTGGIAAYKCVLLARELTRNGARVDVVLSQGAREFVGAVTFEAVTHRPVRSSLWERGGALDHVTLGHDADVIIVAPATAHLMARIAHGLADDLLTSMLLASSAPVVFAPAMNDAMFANPATQANLAVLVARGWQPVGPGVGALAEGPSERPGRMAEPDEILACAARTLRGSGALSRRRVVVTAGPTRESIDPVRVITNRSSGRMGYRLAAAAWQRGADVVLITGPSSETGPIGVPLVRVDTAEQMTMAVREHIAAADILIMAAAPADYRAAILGDTKRPRAEGGFALELIPTEDILLATMDVRPPDLTVVGFALETGDAIGKGRAKLQRKRLDMIVVNDALEPGAGFEVDTNAVTVIDRRGGLREVSLRSKAEVAEAILDAIERYRE